MNTSTSHLNPEIMSLYWEIFGENNSAEIHTCTVSLPEVGTDD